MFARGLLGLIICLAANCTLFGQIILEMESRDHSVAPPRSETSFVVSDGQQLALGLTGGGAPAESGMIYRGTRREMVVLDHRSQTYLVLDQQSMQRLATQLGQAMGQFNQQLQNVPASQRAAMEQLLGNQAPTQPVSQRSPAQVRRTADFAKCFGYPATRYEVWRDGRKVREMWVTDWQNVDGGREVAAVFSDMGGFMGEMLAALPGGGAMADESIFDVMQEVDGFPVGVREYRTDGSIEREWALRSARRQRVDPTTFSPPPNYRRQQLPGG